MFSGPSSSRDTPRSASTSSGATCAPPECQGPGTSVRSRRSDPRGRPPSPSPSRRARESPGASTQPPRREPPGCRSVLEARDTGRSRRAASAGMLLPQCLIGVLGRYRKDGHLPSLPPLPVGGAFQRPPRNFVTPWCHAIVRWVQRRHLSFDSLHTRVRIVIRTGRRRSRSRAPPPALQLASGRTRLRGNDGLRGKDWSGRDARVPGAAPVHGRNLVDPASPPRVAFVSGRRPRSSASPCARQSRRSAPARHYARSAREVRLAILTAGGAGQRPSRSDFSA